jgi:trehalose-phosphatase
MLPEGLGEAMREWCRRFNGAWVEDKQLALAVHYREVPARFQAAFGSGVRRRLEPHRDRIAVVHGKKVFELLPALPWNKASALRQWLDQRPKSLLFFFGDDTHDEPVHAFVRERGGIAVAVGRTGSRAEYALPTPEEVTWMLEWLHREWQARPSGGERNERHGAELESALSGTVSEQEA